MKTLPDLAAILARRKGERHLIVVHSYPDPDALASAFAHRLISAEFGIEADIIYTGRISHPQNLALVRVLGIGLLQFDASIDLSGYQAAVFVDHQGSTVEEIVAALEAAGAPILLVVDHHPPQDLLQPEISIIQAAGATATHYAGFFQQGVIELDSARREHVLAATALMHGILSDTGGFIRANAEDFQAAAYLSRFRDAEALAQIMGQSRSKHAMGILYRALGNRVTIDGFSIAGIGYVRAEDRDAIPQTADFLLTEDTVDTALVYGIVEPGEQGEILVGSLRTSRLTLHPDDFLKEVFGKSLEGYYFGGGREAAGGFTIPIDFLSGGPGDEYRQLKWDTYDAQIKHKVFTKIGVEYEIPAKAPKYGGAPPNDGDGG